MPHRCRRSAPLRSTRRRREAATIRCARERAACRFETFGNSNVAEAAPQSNSVSDAEHDPHPQGVSGHRGAKRRATQNCAYERQSDRQVTWAQDVRSHEPLATTPLTLPRDRIRRQCGTPDEAPPPLFRFALRGPTQVDRIDARHKRIIGVRSSYMRTMPRAWNPCRGIRGRHGSLLRDQGSPVRDCRPSRTRTRTCRPHPKWPPCCGHIKAIAEALGGLVASSGPRYASLADQLWALRPPNTVARVVCGQVPTFDAHRLALGA